MTTHLKYVQEELCLVLEYNWEYPGVESDQDGSGPVWSPRTPQVTLTRVCPILHQS